MDRLKLLIAILLFGFPPVFASEMESDPYAAVEYMKLENGLQVFLAPSAEATLTNIRLEVEVGWDAEDATNWGVSHLLEHVLFRDKELKDEMSYLQLIREAGGEANGTTLRRQTSYFGSIPAKKSKWLLDKFSKMILNPSISDEYVEKEKGTVELERGRPGPVTQILGFNPMDYLKPKYLSKPDFWESEFQISYDEPYTLSQEQLSNQKLTTQQVKDYYRDYYYPANMRLYVTGKFDRSEIIKEINKTWATLPARTGKTLGSEPLPQLREKTYKRLEITHSNPHVYIGTKISGADVRDQEVIKSYLEYLAHRLMKELRNLKGQTYTASAKSAIYRGYGYAIIQFATPKESYQSNLAKIKNHLSEEAEAGALSGEQIREAVDLYLSQYTLSGREAANMMTLATDYEQIINEFGDFTSPYATLQSISPEEYNAILKKFFVSHHRYEYIYKPAQFFAYDLQLLCGIFAIFCFMGLRHVLTKSFANDRIRWIRKIKYPPLKLLEGVTLLIAWYLYAHAQTALDHIFIKIELFQSHILLSQYAASLFSIAITLVIAQGIFSLLPRKLMVVDQDLIIKSVSYYSQKIPLSEIASVEAVRTLTYPFPLTRWWGKVRHRYFFYNFQFWKKGLLIQKTDGKAFFFSMSTPDKACHELQRILHSRPSVPEVKDHRTDHAA